MIAGKVWGLTEALLTTPVLEVHRLVVLPRMRCSLHRHAARWNAFVVTAGRLFIEVHQEAYQLVDVTELGPGQLATVPPGLFHRFRTGDAGAEALEIYYPTSLGQEDIERQDAGGPATEGGPA